MKKVFANRDCIVMVLEQGETTRTDSDFIARMNRALGPEPPNGILGRMNVAQEIWFYDQRTKMFHAWKNRGHVNEIIHRMAEEGINLKVCAAKIDSGTACEIRFDDTKDRFLFNLKYL